MEKENRAWFKRGIKTIFSWLYWIRPFILDIVDRRYAAGFLLLLIFWAPFLDALPMESIVTNLLLLDTYQQLLALATVNTVAVTFLFSLLRVISARNPTQRWSRLGVLVGDTSKPWGTTQFAFTTAASMISPAYLALSYSTELPTLSIQHWIAILLTIVGGVAVAWVSVFILGRIKSVLAGRNRDLVNYFPFEKASRRRSKLGTLVEQVEPYGVLGIDFQLGFYLVILTLIHFAATRLLSGTVSNFVSAASVSVLLIWIAGMLLTGVAYWLDKFRLPTLLVVILVLAALRTVFSNPSTFDTVANRSAQGFNGSIAALRAVEAEALRSDVDRRDAVDKASVSLGDKAWQAINLRMADAYDPPSNLGKTLVIVTCPGGGIHAAAWSAKVLESLSNAYPNLRDSICVISGVSGGSIGTLHFVSHHYPPDTNAKAVNATRSFDAASSSSLEPIAFGMMTDDLFGMFFPPLSLQDRGHRLEQAMKERLPKNAKAATLNEWGDLAMTGKMPIVIFNATDAVTGRRVLFDSIPTPLRYSNIGLISRPFNYRELLKTTDLDVHPATAARASATFPYVSPFVRPDRPSPHGEHLALGDGGYVDNEGIVTAVDWIEFLLRRSAQSDPVNFKRILLLRIAPATTADSLVPNRAHWSVNGLRWLVGPLETLANVRTTSQTERGNVETDLASLLLTQPTSNDSPDDIVADSNGDTSEPVAVTIAKEGAFRATNKVMESAARKQFLNFEKVAGAESSLPSGAEDSPDADAAAAAASELVSQSPMPVIIKELPFVMADDDLVIPLNWKLSKAQKKWYDEAWQRIIEEDKQLTEQFDRLFK